MMTRLSWGTFPVRQEFDDAFESDEVIRRMGGYAISHGSLKVTDDFDAIGGLYEDSEELWQELQRLWTLYLSLPEHDGGLTEKQDRAASWVSDILGTLGFEWI